MPQMMPLNWLTLMLFFTSMFMFMLIKLYFFYKLEIKITNKNNFPKLKLIKIKW